MTIYPGGRSSEMFTALVMHHQRQFPLLIDSFSWWQHFTIHSCHACSWPNKCQIGKKYIDFVMVCTLVYSDRGADLISPWHFTIQWWYVPWITTDVTISQHGNIYLAKQLRTDVRHFGSVGCCCTRENWRVFWQIYSEFT